MAFTVEDFQDLLRLLDQHPEWQAELRRRLLPDELPQLPALVRQLIEAQQRTEARVEALAEAQLRTEQRVGALAEAQLRTEQRVGALAEAQLRTEQRLDALTVRVGALAEAQARTEQRLDALIVRVDALAEDLRQLTLVVRALTERVDRIGDEVADLRDRVGEHTGQLLELEYVRKAVGRFGRIIARGRVLDPGVLAPRLDDAVDGGRLTYEERNAVLDADIVMEGRRTEDRAEVYVLVEVSYAINSNDVDRAVQRSRMLAKLGQPVIPAVAGRSIVAEVDAAASGEGVWRVLDGRAIPPDQAASQAPSG